MNSLPCRKLIEIIVHYGVEVYDDPARFKALMADICRGEHLQERNILAFALAENVPGELLSVSPDQPIGMVLARLSRRLVEDHALSESAARWAVESWALALGKVNAEDLGQSAPSPILTPNESIPSVGEASQGNVVAQIPESASKIDLLTVPDTEASRISKQPDAVSLPKWRIHLIYSRMFSLP